MNRSTNFILFAILLVLLGIGFNLVSSGMQVVTLVIFLIAFFVGLRGIAISG